MGQKSRGASGALADVTGHSVAGALRRSGSRQEEECGKEQLRPSAMRHEVGLWKEMAAVVRRAVPRVVVSPRGDGRKVARAAYRLAPPVTR